MSWVYGVEFLSNLKTRGQISSNSCWLLSFYPLRRQCCPTAPGAPVLSGSVLGHLRGSAFQASNLSSHRVHLPAGPSCAARPDAVFSRLELAFMFSSIFSNFLSPCDFSLLEHVRLVSNHGFMSLWAIPSVTVQSVLIDFLQVMGHDFSIIHMPEQFCLYAGHFHLALFGLYFVIYGIVFCDGLQFFGPGAAWKLHEGRAGAAPAPPVGEALRGPRLVTQA